MMQLRVSSKKQAKIKLALQGCAGSGKTMSALLLAYGLCNDWGKIAIIDSENGSADLYANLGNYNVLALQDNFTPETYMEAIGICENAGMEVIIIDSISQCWDNLLEYHANLQGNSFTNWQKVTPRINAFMRKILQSEKHVICTMRCKQDYVLNEKNGKMIPEKVGLKAVMRDGIDYEFTIVFDINMKHQAIASKDRTNLFMGKPDFTITPTTGQIILDWCNDGVTVDNDVKPYLSSKQEYALPLDVAFPIYSWGIWMRQNDFKSILHKTDFTDTLYYKQMDKWKYVVSKEHYLEGHHLKKGDIIRLETSPLEDIIKVKQLAFSKIRRHPRNIILYHLDSLNIAQYSEENIRLIYK